MKAKEQEFTERIQRIEQSVEWWESKLSNTLDQYENLSPDDERKEDLEQEIKTLLQRAKFEKIEMAKLEDEINQWCADKAFTGNFSNKRKK